MLNEAQQKQMDKVNEQIEDLLFMCFPNDCDRAYAKVVRAKIFKEVPEIAILDPNKSLPANKIYILIEDLEPNHFQRTIPKQGGK